MSSVYGPKAKELPSPDKDHDEPLDFVFLLRVRLDLLYTFARQP